MPWPVITRPHPPKALGKMMITYWQVIAYRALVDERDVAVGNVVVLLGPRGDIPELLRVLLHTALRRYTTTLYRSQQSMRAGGPMCAEMLGS